MRSKYGKKKTSKTSSYSRGILSRQLLLSPDICRCMQRDHIDSIFICKSRTTNKTGSTSVDTRNSRTQKPLNRKCNQNGHKQAMEKGLKEEPLSMECQSVLLKTQKNQKYLCDHYLHFHKLHIINNYINALFIWSRRLPLRPHVVLNPINREQQWELAKCSYICIMCLVYKITYKQ